MSTGKDVMNQAMDEEARGRLSVGLGCRRAAAGLVLVLLAAAMPSGGAPQTAPAWPKDQVRVELIDAQTVQGKLEAMTGQGVVLATPEGKRELPLSGISEITLTAAAPGSPLDEEGKLVVVTASQGPVLASRVTVGGGKVDMTSPLLGRLTADLSSISLLVMPPSGRTAAEVRRKLAEIKTANEAADLFLVGEQIEQAMPVEGVLKSMDDQFITLDWKGQDQRLARKKVMAVALAGAKPADQAAGRLVAGDGSVLAFTKIELAGSKFALQSPTGGALQIPQAGVARIRLASDKIANLLDLTPTSARHYGLLDAGFPHRVNRSAGGKPLSLDGKVHAAGLGLHSFCELTYELGGAYTKLVCQAGIDDAVRPAGDAELTFLADGKVVGQPIRLIGKDNSRSVSVDIAGAKTLTVRVSFGADKVDVGDHVNIISARLIK